MKQTRGKWQFSNFQTFLNTCKEMKTKMINEKIKETCNFPFFEQILKTCNKNENNNDKHMIKQMKQIRGKLQCYNCLTLKNI